MTMSLYSDTRFVATLLEEIKEAELCLIRNKRWARYPSDHVIVHLNNSEAGRHDRS